MPETDRPFSTFNFVLILRRGERTLCEGKFSECDGLEFSFDVKTIREGGNNGTQIHLSGPVSYGRLSFKRGMTSDYDLWDWFESTHTNRSLRLEGEVLILPSNRRDDDLEHPKVKFLLGRCMPVRLRAPSLSAKDGGVAIEEMQVAYETMQRVNLNQEAT